MREVTITNSVFNIFYQLLSVKLMLITNFGVKRKIFFIFLISADKIRSERNKVLNYNKLRKYFSNSKKIKIIIIIIIIIKITGQNPKNLIPAFA